MRSFKSYKNILDRATRLTVEEWRLYHIGVDSATGGDNSFIRAIDRVMEEKYERIRLKELMNEIMKTQFSGDAIFSNFEKWKKNVINYMKNKYPEQMI